MVNSLVVQKEVETIYEIPYEMPMVVLKTRGGKKAKIEGEKALVILEAVKEVLNDRYAPEMGPIQVDLTLPKTFSFARATAIAIALGYETPQEIADFLKREIERYNHL